MGKWTVIGMIVALGIGAAGTAYYGTQKLGYEKPKQAMTAYRSFDASKDQIVKNVNTNEVLVQYSLGDGVFQSINPVQLRQNIVDKGGSAKDLVSVDSLIAAVNQYK
jgi:hypothetical protein